MKIETTRFGTLEVDPEQIIDFPEGILGFEDYHQFVIVEQPESMFCFLQSVEEPWLCFVIMMPELLRHDYQVKLEPQHVKQLGFEDSKDGQVFVIVTVPEDVSEMTANLQAPLVINRKTKLAKQVVLMDGLYSIRHNVLAELQRSSFLAAKQAAE
ncbi:MAG: flagellar assembly protein FliW [Candidatus Wallacebacter cryptica]|nr:flagellar assembly protein FliW [Bacillota bacterium]